MVTDRYAREAGWDWRLDDVARRGTQGVHSCVAGCSVALLQAIRVRVRVFAHPGCRLALGADVQASCPVCCRTFRDAPPCLLSSLLVGAASHKRFNTSEPALLRFYYTFPYALFVICAANEGFLVSLYCLAFVCVAAAVPASSGQATAWPATQRSPTCRAPQHPGHAARGPVCAGVDDVHGLRHCAGVRAETGAWGRGRHEGLRASDAPTPTPLQIISVVQLLNACGRVVAKDEEALAARGE